MSLSELVRFATTLDDDWRSPVADAAAERWDVQRPLFLRSSASHVFVASRPAAPRIVLRMRPDTPANVAVLERGARAAAAWSASGAPFVDAVHSAAGRLVERVDGYAVTALEAAEGEPLDASPMDASSATEWGAAVARLHRAQPPAPADGGLPTIEELIEADGLPSELLRAASIVRERLDELPREPAVRGVLHGDPEPDNIIRAPDGLVLVDPDEVRMGWFVSDVAFALRDWQDAEGRLDWAGGIPAAFLDGYRSVRSLTTDELGTVPLMVAAAALEDLGALYTQLRTPADESWPDWAVTLHAKIGARAAQLTGAVLRGAPPQRHLG